MSQFKHTHTHKHTTLRQLLSMGSIGVGLGRTTLTSSLPHSRTDHSSSTRARTKPATHQASALNMDFNPETGAETFFELEIIRFSVANETFKIQYLVKPNILPPIFDFSEGLIRRTFKCQKSTQI